MSQTILITGSSTGIGKATAKYFHEQGWNVIATMRRPENETELNELDNVLVTRLDVQDHDSIQTAIDAGLERFGQIDVLLNNAGYGLMGTFESISRESIQRQFDVNVFGLMDVTRAVLPHFRANKSGLILNVSSVGGRITFPVISPYHATKWAVEGFTESLQYELAPIGIGVKLIEPGAIATDFGSRSLDMQHNPELTEYAPIMEKIMAVFAETSNQASPASLVAEVIYEASTDGKSQMRYIAGADAQQLLDARYSMDDGSFYNVIRDFSGLN